MFLSSSLSPRTLILTSLTMVLLTSLLLVTTAHTHLELLYLGTGSIGYFVSLQFASGYSWLADQVDLTGLTSSVVFLGANCGWLVFPPLAGLVGASPVGLMAVFYLTLGNLLSPLSPLTTYCRSDGRSLPSLPLSPQIVFQ